jgi:hypothetical protein
MIHLENLKPRISARKYKEMLISIFRYLLETQTENPCVPGSIPGPGTSKFKHLSSFSVGAFFFGSLPVLFLPGNDGAGQGSGSANFQSAGKKELSPTSRTLQEIIYQQSVHLLPRPMAQPLPQGNNSHPSPVFPTATMPKK